MEVSINLRYDTEMQKITLSLEDACKWLSVTVDPTADYQEIVSLIQKAVDDQYNKPEYNNWHTYHRHVAPTPKARMLDGHKGRMSYEDEEDDDFLNQYPDMRTADELERKFSREALEELLRKMFPEETARAMMAVFVDGVPTREYARQFCDDPNNPAELAKAENSISHRLNRAKKYFEKIYPDVSDFDLSRGYTV